MFCYASYVSDSLVLDESYTNNNNNNNNWRRRRTMYSSTAKTTKVIFLSHCLSISARKQQQQTVCSVMTTEKEGEDACTSKGAKQWRVKVDDHAQHHDNNTINIQDELDPAVID